MNKEGALGQPTPPTAVHKKESYNVSPVTLVMRR
jgi:hypothetical protein